jgi:hypothetical protein
MTAALAMLGIEWLSGALMVAICARRGGRNGLRWFLLAMLVTPLAGAIFLGIARPMFVSGTVGGEESAT